MNQIKFSLPILALIFSINAVAQNKVVVVPLIENAPPGAIYVKSNGVKVGVYLGGYELGEGPIPYKALSLKEYFFAVLAHSGSIDAATLVYAGSNCTGTAYHPVYEYPDPPIAGTYIAANGFVFSSSNTGDIYYVPKGAQTNVRQVMSISLAPEGTCDNYSSQTMVNSYPALPNDPAVTGVQNSYALPLSAGF